MALVALKNENIIDGIKIVHTKQEAGFDEKEYDTIVVDETYNRLSIVFQDGPVGEADSKPGCQVVTAIALLKLIVSNLNKNHPCLENNMTINKLNEAITWQNLRTIDRESRGVEGTNKI